MGNGIIRYIFPGHVTETRCADLKSSPYLDNAAGPRSLETRCYRFLLYSLTSRRARKSLDGYVKDHRIGPFALSAPTCPSD